jgi:hypothetical protein
MLYGEGFRATLLSFLMLIGTFAALRSFVAQYRIRDIVVVDIPGDRFRTVGHHHQDLGLEGFEVLVVMAQLRHMVGAMRSDKAYIEDQQYIIKRFFINC